MFYEVTAVVYGAVADCAYYYYCAYDYGRSTETILIPATAACGAYWPYWTPPPTGHTA